MSIYLENKFSFLKKKLFLKLRIPEAHGISNILKYHMSSTNDLKTGLDQLVRLFSQNGTEPG